MVFSIKVQISQIRQTNRKKNSAHIICYIDGESKQTMRAHTNNKMPYRNEFKLYVKNPEQYEELIGTEQKMLVKAKKYSFFNDQKIKISGYKIILYEIQ